MFRSFINLLFVALLSAGAFVSGYWAGTLGLGNVPLGPAIVGAPNDARQTFEPFWEVWRLVHDEYFEQPVDDAALIGGAIDGMLATLGDQNTVYLEPEAQQALEESISGEFQGIGAEVESIDGAVTIVAPFEGSPAEEAGLRPGDILREADGVALTDMDIGEAAALVRGPAGSEVQLVIERDGVTFDLAITRGVIRVPSVRGEIIEEGLAYIRLNRFGEETDEELSDLLDELLVSNPAGLIIDLRRNPGGILETAVNVSDEFLSEGPILVERFGNGREVNYDAQDGDPAETLPIVVLIDEGSASASELLAGALRDRGRAVLIGATSFGKGTVQTWRTLSNGGGIRLTVARWLTPAGIWVHEAGLEPDYFVPVAPTVDEGDPDDTQLQAAIDFLLGRPVESVPPQEAAGGE